MVAQRYFDGDRCVECFVLFEHTKGKWGQGRCNKHYQALWRSKKEKPARKPYERQIPTEREYRKRIRHIAKVNVPDDLRNKFLHTFLVDHNPYRGGSQ